MNEGKIWTVVKPNHGVPLFLAAVMVTSLTVHFAILNNTTWFAAFLNGNAKAPMTASAVVAPATAPAAATPSSAAPAPVTP